MLHVERTEEGVFIPLKSGNHAEMRVKICGSQQEFLQAYKILSSSAIHLKNQFGLSYWLPYPSFEGIHFHPFLDVYACKKKTPTLCVPSSICASKNSFCNNKMIKPPFYFT
eukprot:Sdes_comp20120_c0_seq3m13159